MIKRSLSDDYHIMTRLSKSQDIAEALAWCKVNIPYDPEGGSMYDRRGWAYERFFDSTNFVFHREKDAFMFSLRWE